MFFFLKKKSIDYVANLSLHTVVFQLGEGALTKMNECGYSVVWQWVVTDIKVKMSSVVVIALKTPKFEQSWVGIVLKIDM